MRLLIVEDDPLLGDGLKAGMTLEGYAVDWVMDGETAWTSLEAQPEDCYDAAIVDLQLPHLDGLSLIRRIRQMKNQTATLSILILTAKDTREDIVKGLDAGADDYLTKPFDLAELQARLRALIRRSHAQPENVLSFGDIRLDPINRSVTRVEINPETQEECQVSLALSAKEFAILHQMMLHPQRLFTKDDFINRLYAADEEVGSNVIEVHMFNLRKKLGGQMINTVRGMGYNLAPTDKS